MSDHWIVTSDERRYWTQVPNVIFELGLSPHELTLYIYLKRVAGDNGTCYQSTVTIAQATGMSTGKVSQAKQRLQTVGLIRIETQKHNGKGQATHHITIVDIWALNMGYYAGDEHCANRVKAMQEQLKKRSPDERPQSVHQVNAKRSPGETKKNPIRKKSASLRDARKKLPPAVKAFRKATHRFPPKAWYDEIAKTVGEDETNLAFWYDVCHAYVGNGWNPMNVKAMLEFFKRGEMPSPAFRRDYAKTVNPMDARSRPALTELSPEEFARAPIVGCST